MHANPCFESCCCIFMLSCVVLCCRVLKQNLSADIVVVCVFHLCYNAEEQQHLMRHIWTSYAPCSWKHIFRFVMVCYQNDLNMLRCKSEQGFASTRLHIKQYTYLSLFNGNAVADVQFVVVVFDCFDCVFCLFRNKFHVCVWCARLCACMRVCMSACK